MDAERSSPQVIYGSLDCFPRKRACTYILRMIVANLEIPLASLEMWHTWNFLETIATIDSMSHWWGGLSGTSKRGQRKEYIFLRGRFGHSKIDGNRGAHASTTFWADESQVLVFNHVMLLKRMGHESSSFRTLFHVVGMFCSLPTCLLPICTTSRGVTFGNQSMLAGLRVKVGKFSLRLHDAFGFWFFHGRYKMPPLFLLRSGLWQRVAWFGIYVAKRVCEARRSAPF